MVLVTTVICKVKDTVIHIFSVWETKKKQKNYGQWVSNSDTQGLYFQHA